VTPTLLLSLLIAPIAIQINLIFAMETPCFQFEAKVVGHYDTVQRMLGRPFQSHGTAQPIMRQ